MGFIQAYKMAIKSILSSKVRSFLTMLGVIIGVGAVMSAVAYAQGSTKSITDSIQGLGTNLVSITIQGRGSNRNVTYTELEKLAEENSSTIQAIAPTVSGTVTLKYGNESMSTSLIGTNEDYEEVKSTHVQEGRFVVSFDNDYRLKVALIGTAIVNTLYGDDDPIDSEIKINGTVFKVVGIIQETAGGLSSTDDDRIIIPVTVAQRLLKSSIIRNFSVQAVTAEDVDSVVSTLNTFLEKKYSNTRSFSVRNQAQMLSTLSSVTDKLMLMLGGIATISLVVGGIGIMNIMLVSVTERTREIGIRKAIGAKKKNILIQFLIEAIMVTGMGGLIGIILGILIIRFLVAGLAGVPAVYSAFWMALSFGISLGVGVIFGMFPAFKAANLNPIEALRFE